MLFQSKSFRKVVFFLVILFVLTVVPNNAYAAYTSVSLSPSSGKIGTQETAIELKVNSGTDEYIGGNIVISFTGAVEYVRATQSKCGSFTVTPGTGQVEVECFFMDGGTYNGTIATLYFKATGTGQSTFTIVETDPAASTKTGGTYTLVTGTGTTPPTTRTNLPSTGLLDKTTGLIVLGGILILAGVFFSRSGLLGGANNRRQRNFEKKF